MTIHIFHTGKCRLLGGKSYEDLRTAMTRLYPLLMEFAKKTRCSRPMKAITNGDEGAAPLSHEGDALGGDSEVVILSQDKRDEAELRRLLRVNRKRRRDSVDESAVADGVRRQPNAREKRRLGKARTLGDRARLRKKLGVLDGVPLLPEEWGMRPGQLLCAVERCRYLLDDAHVDAAHEERTLLEAVELERF
mmetsp:Transcript_14929/g.56669  ORF Transcript_14929/g.56669 Transcript_14929/m.56669 type:complete len:192 (-) Transcript_14929:3957-4532(-)